MKGFILFLIIILFPLSLLTISSYLIINNFWSQLCYIWLGISVILGLFQIVLRIFRNNIIKYNNNININNENNLDSNDPVSVGLSGSSGKIQEFPNSESSKIDDSSPMTDDELYNAENLVLEKIDDSPIEPLNFGFSRRKYLDHLSKNILWTNNYNIFNISDIFRFLILDLLTEYSKSDLRHFKSFHWIYNFHLVQGLFSVIIGIYLLIFLPMPIINKFSVVILLIYCLMEFILSFIYFFTLLWTGSYLKGIYCIYWLPVFFQLFSNMMFFEYSIYLLNITI